jgi:hypothetical protein
MTKSPSHEKVKNRTGGWSWLTDLDFQGRTIIVRTTGAKLRLDVNLLNDVWRWFSLYAPIWMMGFFRRSSQKAPKIWFWPQPARPWYLIWNVATYAGFKIVSDPKMADLHFRFEDATVVDDDPTAYGMVNGRCLSVSKTKVAEAFAKSFGYELAVDPLHYKGPMVEKGEDNGVHDGRIIEGPSEPNPQKTYQKLIDNIEPHPQVPEGLSTDLRTPFIAGIPIVVYVKQRPQSMRFANSNRFCALKSPHEVFSVEEIEKLSALARELSLDWGGMDILRDRQDGRLYVVDVNKTDMGPPLVLSWSEKWRSLDTLSKALWRHIYEARA